MSVLYIGDCSFALKAPGIWKPDPLALDHYTEEWQGRADELDTFLAAHSLGDAHPNFSGIFLCGKPSDGKPVFPTVTLEYVGFQTATPRAPIYKPSKTVQSVQSSADLPDSGQASIEAQFYAPAGEWSWYQYTDPGETPDHYAVLSTANPRDAIFRWKVTVQDGSSPTISLADMVAALDSLSVVETVQNFESEAIVPGKLWYCRCSSVRTLQAS